VLAEIISPEDIDASITKIIQQGLVSLEESEILKQTISELLSLNEVSTWFTTDWQVKTESEILLQDGTTLRPDRVLLKENKAIIIDYKTGKEETKHADQVNGYANVLNHLGYTSIDKFLFYLNERRIKRIMN
jgi:ATP-dependent exoDNAse (exonuclease V) beta subunit